ncbi:GGDEF domain-containing protein [Halobacillus fulvus]|nr:GGDEF domain-containing protein [Halobacillus fulvus]
MYPKKRLSYGRIIEYPFPYITDFDVSGGFPMIVELFINLCVLVALIFSYLQFRWNTLEEKLPNRTLIWIDGIAGGVLGNILLYFSITVSEQTLVDLRQIPIMALLLFTGIRPAAIAALIITGGRFLYGFNLSSFTSVTFMVALFLGFWLIHRYCQHKQKILHEALIMLLYANIVFTITITYLIRDLEILMFLVPVYWGISFVAGLSVIYLIHYLRTSHLLFKKYQEQSMIDYLTGLNNVRQFSSIWNRLIERAEANQEKLSLLFIDIDHFKKVNDTYGHQAGDLVLQQISELLMKNTRNIDIVSRNGGEEFSVILKDCPQTEAIEIAERIRSAIERYNFFIGSWETIQLTVSVGVSSYPDQDLGQLIESADQSLYKAKENGRNQVVSSL